MIMVKRAAQAVRLVVKNMVWAGFSVQICLGLAWMAANFAKVQHFPAVEAGLYPLLLRLAGGGYALVYLLQLGFALYAGYRLLGKLCPGEAFCPGGSSAAFRLWGSLALMTLPMALQCHMALLPYSFVASLGLLQLSFVCEAAGVERLRQGTGLPAEKERSCADALIGCVACYAAQVQLWHEYWMPGAVLPLLLLLWKLPGLRRERVQLRKGMLAAVCFLVLAAACFGSQWREAEGEGSVSGWRWMLVKRLCWPTLWVDLSPFCSEWNLPASDLVWQSSYYPHRMDEILKPALEEALPQETAGDVLLAMAERSWKVHYPMVVRQVGWDVLGYGVSPLILPLQLKGEAYDSRSLRNYEIMREGTPLLAKYYVYLSCGWFAAFLALAAAGAALSCIGRRVCAGEGPGKAAASDAGEAGRIQRVFRSAAPVLAVAASAGMCILIFTMQGAGIMDYKYTVWINQLWIAAGIKMVIGEGDCRL